MKKLIAVCAAAGLILAVNATAGATSVASSTMVFQGALTDVGGGVYTGVLAHVPGAGFDIYAKSGDSAWFGNDPGSGAVWTEQPIGADHDAWPTWTRDTPDWYQYSIELTAATWAVRNHPGATATNPWDDIAYWGGTGKAPMGVPMSGIMDWGAMIAVETDTGAYLLGTGTPEIPGGAASKGGGAGYWDMDWSWGSEAVPLEYSTFAVHVDYVAGGTSTVTVSPVPEPMTMIAVGMAVAGLGGYIRKRRMA